MITGFVTNATQFAGLSSVWADKDYQCRKMQICFARIEKKVNVRMFSLSVTQRLPMTDCWSRYSTPFLLSVSKPFQNLHGPPCLRVSAPLETTIAASCDWFIEKKKKKQSIFFDHTRAMICGVRPFLTCTALWRYGLCESITLLKL